MHNSLQVLALSYKSENPPERSLALRSLYNRYVHEREESLIDAAATAVSVSALLEHGSIDQSALTPQMKEAFHLAYPHVSFDGLRNMSHAQLEGILNAWKGKLFEVIVRDRLNRGEWVGDLHLLAGQHAELAHSAVQPGWDIRILSPHGHVTSQLQLKATESLAYLKHALERYPGIHVVATHEAASHGAHAISGLLDSGVSNHRLHETIAGVVDFGQHGWLSLLHDFAPFVPFVIIATSEGKQLLMGKKTFEVATHHALARALKTGASMAVGALVVWLDGGLLSIPASFVTRLGIDRVQASLRVVRRLESRSVQVQALSAQYCPA